MSTNEFSNIIIPHHIEETWTRLIRTLGLETGYLDLPFENLPKQKSPDDLIVGMRLQTIGTAGTIRSAILSELNSKMHVLNIKVLKDQNYQSNAVRDYHFSLLPTGQSNMTELQLNLTLQAGLLGKLIHLIDKNRLANSMVENIKSRIQTSS